jgi:hypothetical protein
MASRNYFDSSRKRSNLYFEWKSVIIEMHEITKSTNLHVILSFGEVINTAKSLGIHQAALIYKITVNVLLESK